MPINLSRQFALMVFAIALLLNVSTLHATLPALYPTFSTPSTIDDIELNGTIASPDDQLAEVTLAGAYNQLQGTNRAYINIDSGNGAWWLKQSIPSTITVNAFSWTQTDPDGALKAMLTAYGSSIAGYVICEPYNNPESCNMATTFAGIHDAMVVTPDNLAVMAGYPSIPLIAGGDMRTYNTPTGSQYTWIGSNSTLVGNTTINQVSNPSGGGGTTGWTTNCGAGQTLGTATFLSVTALKWTSLANEGTCYAYYKPAAGALTLARPYIFSVQVAGSGNVYLDAWDGTLDRKSSVVTLNSTAYQTIQIAIPVPTSDNSNPVQIQVRANTSSNAVTAYFINAAVVGDYVAVDTYQYNNLISSTSTLTTCVLSPTSMDNRDYLVAGKIFTYYLGSDSTHADEKTLFGNVLNHAAANTPVLGWIKNEGSDVAYLSGSGQNHYLTTTNNYRNGSIWASFTPPASLAQPAPAGVKALNGYVYVAFGMSDGDNFSFVQGQDQNDFTLNQYLGAVPVAWTTSLSAIDFSPGVFNYFYKFLPQSNEMMAGASGVGYETAMTGTALSTFASNTNTFMTALDMSSVTSWQNSTTDLTTFATDLNLPHVVWKSGLTLTQEGNAAKTVLDGQWIGYNNTPAQNISAIQAYASAHWVSTAPLFIEALADDATLGPDDMLYIAQQLELNRVTNQHYIFLTPSELALTEANYLNSGTLTAQSNTQAVFGSALLAGFPVNLMQNGSGQWQERLGGGFTLATTGNHEALSSVPYLGYNTTLLTTDQTTTSNVIAQSAITNVPVAGQFYDFHVRVAGSGTVEMGVYNGSAWHYTSVVTLTAAFQTLDLVSAAPASGGLIQIILPAQTGLASVYFINDSLTPNNWSMIGVVSNAYENLGITTYDYGQALVFTLGNTNGHVQQMSQNPNVKPSTQYVWSADVAGSGVFYLEVCDGSSCAHDTSKITLTPQYQHLSETVTTATTGTTTFLVRTDANTNPQTVYVRNASVTPPLPTNFYTGVEIGDPPLTWTNTVDTTSPGGNESNVSSAVLQLTTTEMSHNGGNAIQYGGTASGGTTNYAYMEAFSNSTVLSSTSRLSYWIFPQSPLGAEPNASSTTGLNSTCAAIDIIFTDGTALRNLTGINDQYGNPIHPHFQCNHLQPDQWNYVTANLSSISGKTVSRIDIGYDQPGSGAAGSYRGYVDDISLTH